MDHIKPNFSKRSYLLPPGCKNLADLLPPVPVPKFAPVNVRVNGRIKAAEVSVIGSGGQPLGILPLTEALRLAMAEGVDLVEIDPHARPPIFRLVNFGKFRYEQAKSDSSKNATQDI